jgi:parvulin-like peptidyl-prolyl isomerase
MTRRRISFVLGGVLAPFFLLLTAASAQPQIAARLGNLTVSAADLALIAGASSKDAKPFADAEDAKDIATNILEARRRLENANTNQKLALSADQKTLISIQGDVGRHRELLRFINDLAEKAVPLEPRSVWMKRAREIYETKKRNEFLRSEAIDASHIVFRFDQRTPQELTKVVETARAKLNEGKSFSDVAREHSEDPNAKKDGGKLPLFTRKEVDSLFARNVFKSPKPGSLIGPFFSRTAVHLVLVHAVVPESPKPFDEVQEQLVLEARAETLSQYREGLLATLDGSESVEFFPSAVAQYIAERPPTTREREALNHLRQQNLMPARPTIEGVGDSKRSSN